jgi:tetratricopeptide (TPR) repeat protein
MSDPLDEILSLVSQAKQELYNQVGMKSAAEKEQVRAAKYQLEAAIGAAREGKFGEALRLFKNLQNIIEESKLIESEWAEIYVAQAICHARLGQKYDMKQVWQKAYRLEPSNAALKEIAVRLGLL